MTRATAVAKAQHSLDMIGVWRADAPPARAWVATASAAIIAVAEVADAVRDVAAAIREAR